MAKRMTDTAKWKKEFIRGLSAKHKLLWFYILDDCDHAGVWEVDFEVASLRIGETIVPSEALEALSEQVAIIGKNRWWIRDFISFQYGNLTPKNKMYAPVMAVLNKYGIDPNMPDSIPHKPPIDGVKVKDKVKDKDKEEVKVKDNAAENEKFEYPLTEDLRVLIEEKLLELDEIYLDQQRMKWPHLDFDFEYRTFCEKVRGSPDFYRDHQSIRLAFQKQLRDSRNKKQPNGTSKTTQNRNISHVASVAEDFARRHGGKQNNGG
jgi:hypothetical protein